MFQEWITLIYTNFAEKILIMNDYKKVIFEISPVNEDVADVLAALLAEVSFESFVSEPNGITAYVQHSLFDAGELDSVIANFPIEGYKINYSIENIEGRDWNIEWEKNYFQPIVVDDKCVIHSTFHTDVPAAEYDILIDPKMAFGTGYHQTTCHMLRAILASDMCNKSVLDMGCGTALLAILASMRGASNVVAIDIDEFAYENAKENIKLNSTPGIEIRLGGIEAIKDSDSFDYVIANINSNILIADMWRYAQCMHKGATLFMSGFYVEDIDALMEEAGQHGLRLVRSAEDNRWAMMELVKD